MPTVLLKNSVIDRNTKNRLLNSRKNLRTQRRDVTRRTRELEEVLLSTKDYSYPSRLKPRGIYQEKIAFHKNHQIISKNKLQFYWEVFLKEFL